MNCCHEDPLKSLLSPSRVYEFRMYDNLQLKGLLPFLCIDRFLPSLTELKVLIVNILVPLVLAMPVFNNESFSY